MTAETPCHDTPCQPWTERVTNKTERPKEAAPALPFFARLMHASPQTLLTVAILIGALCRMPLLTRTSLWYDEAASWQQSSGTLAEVFARVAMDNYPPLHNLVLWGFIQLFGTSELVLRAPSLLAGVLGIWLIYLVGKVFFNEATGLTAACLLALSPMHLWYSGEARMYTLFCALGLCLLLALAHSLRQPSRLAILLTSLATAAFLYTHIYAAFSVAGLGLALIVLFLSPRLAPELGRTTIAKNIISLGVGSLMFLPWVKVLLTRVSAVEASFWIPTPDLAFLRELASQIGGTPSLFWIFLALSALAVLGFLFKSPAKTEPRHDIGLSPQVGVILITCFTLSPALLGYGLSLSYRPILYDRYLIAGLAGLLLLASFGASRLLQRGGQLALVVVALSLGLPALNNTVLDKPKPDYRDAAAAFTANQDPSTAQTSQPILYIYDREVAPAFSYYLGDTVDIKILEAPEIQKVSAGTKEVWLAAGHLTGDQYRLIGAAGPPGFTETFRWQGFGWGQGGLLLIRFQNLSGL